MITAVVGTYISIAKTEKKNDKLPTYIDLIVPVPISQLNLKAIKLNIESIYAELNLFYTQFKIQDLVTD